MQHTVLTKDFISVTCSVPDPLLQCELTKLIKNREHDVKKGPAD